MAMTCVNEESSVRKAINYILYYKIFNFNVFKKCILGIHKKFIFSLSEILNRKMVFNLFKHSQ